METSGKSVSYGGPEGRALRRSPHDGPDAPFEGPDAPFEGPDASLEGPDASLEGPDMACPDPRTAHLDRREGTDATRDLQGHRSFRYYPDEREAVVVTDGVYFDRRVLDLECSFQHYCCTVCMQLVLFSCTENEVSVLKVDYMYII